MDIIDFRMRPPTDEYRAEFRMLPAQPSAIIPQSWWDGTLESCLAEMEQAGITKAVVVGRQLPSVRIPNDHVADLERNYPEKFVGIAGIDPTNRVEAMREIERSIKDLGLKGIHFDHGHMQPPWLANDKRLYPLYGQAEDMGICVLLQVGYFAGPDLIHSSPIPIEEVAKDFPNLQIVCAHGCFGHVAEVIAIAMKRPNVWVSPDGPYLFMPGASMYIEAANGALRDRFLFGTAYPFAELVPMTKRWLEAPFTEAVRDKVFYQNAVRLLKLEE